MRRGINKPKAVTLFSVEEFFGADEGSYQFLGFGVFFYHLVAFFGREDQVAAIGGLAAFNHGRQLGAEGFGSALYEYIGGVEKIAVDVIGFLPVVVVVVYVFFVFIVAAREADDDAMDVCFVDRLAIPDE